MDTELRDTASATDPAHCTDGKMELHARIEIARPAAEVFEYISNFERNPEWQSGMQAARFTSIGPLRVGSTYEQTARFLGREIRSTFEVTALMPGQSVSIATIESTFPIQVTRSVESAGESRCVVTAHIRGEPLPWYLAPLGPLIRRLGQRSVTSDYEGLKAALES